MSRNSKVASSEEVFSVFVIILAILLGLAFASFESDRSLPSSVLFFAKASVSTGYEFSGDMVVLIELSERGGSVLENFSVMNVVEGIMQAAASFRVNGT